MDLFMSNMTTTQQWTQLKTDYKKMFECEQNGQSKFKLTYGDKKNFGNCILLILPFVSEHGFMNADYEKKNLLNTLKYYNLKNYIIVYAQPSKSSSASHKLIKQSRELMSRIIEIISPKAIIVLDDTSAELFINKKPNISEEHGNIITTYFDIPVILTYNLDYYSNRTGYEDKTYKNNIYFNDWDIIKNKYIELIKE